jgi:prepilin-type N-terminal cleavage/methylation domain-containing protein
MALQRSAASGFTLVELSISLTIIALILGGAMTLLSGLMLRAELTENRNKLDQFRVSVLGFASRTQRLPKYTGTAPEDDELSASNSSAVDFWNRKLVYLYDPELSRTDVIAPICAKQTTNLALKTCSDGACSSFTTIKDVAFVFFSVGKNGINQTDAAPTGAVRTEPAPYDSYSGKVGGFGTANLKTILTFGPGNQVGAYSSPTTSPTDYDDHLFVITLDELRQRLGCSTKPLRILSKDLPMGAQDATYSVDILADGGVPISSTEKFRWCVESGDTNLATDLSFKVVDRNGVDYTGGRTIVKQAAGTCVLSSETIWGTGDTLRLFGANSGKLSNSGGARTRAITVFVRDNQNNDTSLTGADPNDNFDSRPFVIPINGP